MKVTYISGDDKSLTDLHELAMTGVIPTGSILYQEDYETFAARGRVADCSCELIKCKCSVIRSHKEGCMFRLAISCAIPIGCDDHDDDECPTCYACDCGT